MTLMYEKTLTWNPFVGCAFNCSYCYARRFAKRLKCEKCRAFVPHPHRERLGQKFPKDSQVFVCSMGDPYFMGDDFPLDEMLQNIENQPNVTFMIQSKNPACFYGWDCLDNLILGTTAETDADTLAISKAPAPVRRLYHLNRLSHARKYLTIEPILAGLLWSNIDDNGTIHLINEIKDLHLERVYIGYDNHNHHLNEPSLDETEALIVELEKFTDVRRKTIRKAWWE